MSKKTAITRLHTQIAELAAENAVLKTQLNTLTPYKYTADDIKRAEIQAIVTDRNRLIDYFEAGSNLQITLVSVDNYASLTNNPLTRQIAKEALQDADKAIATQFLQLTECARKCEFDPTFEVVTSMVNQRIEGVQRLISGQDNGDYLRQAILDTGAVRTRDMMNLIAELAIGRPHDTIVNWIHKNITELRQPGYRTNWKQLYGILQQRAADENNKAALDYLATRKPSDLRFIENNRKRGG